MLDDLISPPDIGERGRGWLGDEYGHIGTAEARYNLAADSSRRINDHVLQVELLHYLLRPLLFLGDELSALRPANVELGRDYGEAVLRGGLPYDAGANLLKAYRSRNRTDQTADVAALAGQLVHHVVPLVIDVDAPVGAALIADAAPYAALGVYPGHLRTHVLPLLLPLGDPEEKAEVRRFGIGVDRYELIAVLQEVKERGRYAALSNAALAARYSQLHHSPPPRNLRTLFASSSKISASG